MRVRMFFSGRAKSGLLIAVLLIVTAALLIPTVASAQEVLPVDGKAWGRTYGDLALDWWQWSISIPAAVNPVPDETGENAAEGQKGKIWFLAGNFGGETTRVITVPKNKALFFPIINYGGWAPTDGTTEEEVRATANSFTDLVTVVECTIDVVPLQAV